MPSTPSTGRSTPRARSSVDRRRLTIKGLFALGGTISLILSVSLFFLFDQPEEAIFVGLWVPSLFSLGALTLSPGGWSE
jgi:hypothetical protein